MADDEILGILRNIQQTLNTVQQTIGTVQQTVGTHERLLLEHERLLNILVQDTRMIRSALNDKARVEITAGEIEAMHHDINRVIRDMAALQTRMDRLEHN